jgi:tyrosyl-tRNA synthetase
MLAGRDLMKNLLHKEKFVLTNKLLTDPSGKKMGKSEGNIIALIDSADEMFGKIMSWPDEMIVSGFEIVTRVPEERIAEVKKELASGANPRDLKIELARVVVALLRGEESAVAAEENFIKIFSDKEKPADIPEIKVSDSNILEVLVAVKFATSKAEARRLLAQNGVKVNDEVVTDIEFEVPTGAVVQKGKRFFVKIKIN